MIFGLSLLDFQLFKLYLVESTGLAKDALHIYAGLMLFLAIRLLWRRRGGWLLAWTAVLAMACAAEYIDALNEHQRGDLRPDAEHWHDIWNTAFWPTISALVGPWLQPRPKPAPEASGDLADQSFKQPPAI